MGKIKMTKFMIEYITKMIDVKIEDLVNPLRVKITEEEHSICSSINSIIDSIRPAFEKELKKRGIPLTYERYGREREIVDTIIDEAKSRFSDILSCCITICRRREIDKYRNELMNKRDKYIEDLRFDAEFGSDAEEVKNAVNNFINNLK